MQRQGKSAEQKGRRVEVKRFKSGKIMQGQGKSAEQEGKRV
jgi:hypothetical protein